MSVLTEIRVHLLEKCAFVVNAYSSVRWLWYLRRTDFALVRGYLPNTATSVMRIAENLTGRSRRVPDEDVPWVDVPLTFALDEAAFARLARLLAAAEMINHAEGWLRRSSKNAQFIMVEEGFPDLVENLELEAAIDSFDQRVVAAASYRWHPSLSPIGSSIEVPPLILTPMLLGGVGSTPMWRGRVVDTPTLFPGEGRFAIEMAALTDQSNAVQLRGSLESMPHPEIAAALVVMSQALMWHAMWHAENLGISVPRVGYLLLREEDLLRRLSEVLTLAEEQTWPAMHGFVPVDASSALNVLLSLDEWGVVSAPGPVVRRWRNGTLLVDAHSLTVGLTNRLRLSPSAGGARVNATAREFELAVQTMVGRAGLAPSPEVGKLRGRSLRLRGQVITDVDAFMQVDGVLVCISCKKFELARPYDAGDYASVRNAKSNIETAVVEWAAKLEVLRANPIGENYDLSSYERIVGLVVTPELAFVSSVDALATVQLNDSIAMKTYMSYGEFHTLVSELGS